MHDLSELVVEFFKELAPEQHLIGVALQTFSIRAVHYWGELNALHSFRDGNRTTQREFISHLEYEKGYYLAWENVTRGDMLEAFIASFEGELSKLTVLVRENLFPRDAG